MKITLYNNGRAYFEKEVFTLCDEPLLIDVEADEAYNNLYAVCTIGNERSVIKVKDGVLTIPPTFLAPGILCVSFRQIENAEPTKRWNAEKIVLREIEDRYEVIPEMALLRNEIDTVKKAIKELYSFIIKNNQI